MGSRVGAMGVLAVVGLLVACPRVSDLPGVTTGLTTGIADTDPIPGPDPVSGQGLPESYGRFGEFCVQNDACDEGECLSLADLGLVDDRPETTGLPPGDAPIDTDGAEVTAGGGDFPDDIADLGLCTRRCVTVFGCPEVGWSCDLDLELCVPDEILPYLG